MGTGRVGATRVGPSAPTAVARVRTVDAGSIDPVDEHTRRGASGAPDRPQTDVGEFSWCQRSDVRRRRARSGGSTRLIVEQREMTTSPLLNERVAVERGLRRPHGHTRSVIDRGHGTEGPLGIDTLTRCHLPRARATSRVSGHLPFGTVAQSVT